MSLKIDHLIVKLPARNDEQFRARHPDGERRPDTRTYYPAVVESICLALFDRWCERRNVMALAYLMHGWPVLADTPSMARRLLRSLRELKEHHSEVLSSEEIALLDVIFPIDH
jgi:hypothetical protein